ncbi:hypothetical protein GCM10025871_19100 [Deinococcus metallilatus]|nr:hypothetical protein GCM10025871_19100 [Deinococcus metallilatus]
MPEMVRHIQGLLTVEAWEAARLHLLAGARGARSRQDGTLLGNVAREVPRSLWREPGWRRSLAWAAYRAGDVPLMRELLTEGADGVEAFGAFLACAGGRWTEALALAGVGLAGPDPAVAARFRAQALLRSGSEGWREAYTSALHVARGRDRALVRLDYAVALAWAEDDVAARPEFAQAAVELVGDMWGLAFAWSSLGITCLRLGDLVGAERALKQAQKAAGKEATGQHLMTVHLGLGGIYRAHGEFPRARWAFREAGRLAVGTEDRVVALLGEARTLALWGRPDEALTVLYDAAGQAGILDPEAGNHRVFVEIAAVRLLLNDEEGAQAALARAGQVVRDDLRLAGVLRAELRRRQGHPEEAAALLGTLRMRPAWAAEMALLFPPLFALLDVTTRLPPWVAEVNADGPVTVRMHGEPLPLRAARPEAALLVMLVMHGGSLGRERLQEELDLPGRDENARRKELSRAVVALRAALGWPEAVTTGGSMVVLSDEVQWRLHLPPPERADLFCEGRLDPWVNAWRIDNAPLIKLE